MRILEVAPDFPPVVRGGGAQTFYLLADSWVRLGHKVTVLTSAPGANLSMFQAENFGFELRPFPLFNPPKNRENLTYHMPMRFGSIRAYRKYLKDAVKEFDLIVIHGFLETLPLISLLFIDKKFLKKVVLTNHGLSTAEYSPIIHQVSKLAYNSLGRIILSGIQKVVMYSKSALNEFKEYYPSKPIESLIIHPLGIDAETLRNSFKEYLNRGLEITDRKEIENGKSYFLAIGRNAHIKGFDILLRSLSLLSEEHFRPVLLIAGDRTPYTEHLEKLAYDLGLGSQVSFLGRINEAQKIGLMAECQALVIPSLKEGYGINAIEGRTLGIPVIATDTGAHNEILGHYQHGIIIPPGNSNALADAMRNFMDSPRRRTVEINEEYLSSVDIKALAEFYLGLVG